MNPIPSPHDAPPPRILALGDSYTIGEGIEPADRWPVVLAARLRDFGFTLGEPEIVARTGWTTDELSAELIAANPRGSRELVSLMIGVNDQYRGRSVEDYRAAFAPLLERAATLAGGRPGRVMVFSIPDWGVTPFASGRDRAAIGLEIDALNATARASAARVGAWWVDVTTESRRAGGVHAMLAADGLHPSALHYAAWVEIGLPVALAALGGGR